MFHAVLARQTVRLFGAWKIVQADVTDGQVTQDGGNIQRFTAVKKFVIRAFIEVNGVLKPVLTVIDIGDIAVEPCQSKPVFMGTKNRPRLFAQAKSALIL